MSTNPMFIYCIILDLRPICYFRLNCTKGIFPEKLNRASCYIRSPAIIYIADNNENICCLFIIAGSQGKWKNAVCWTSLTLMQQGYASTCLSVKIVFRKSLLLHFSQTREFWSSKANWQFHFSLPSIILTDLLVNKTLS